VAVRYRFMKPTDVPKCVEGIAAHPVLGPRYGSLINDLPSAIRHALGHDSFRAVVFEEFQGSTTKFLGAGMAVFVSDEFLQELKTTPFFWVGPELVKRISRGNSPLLSDADVRDANSTAGLNLVVWHNTVHPEDMRRAEVGTPAMTSFEDCCRGFRLRELMGQADCLEQLHGMRNAGGLYFLRAENRYANFPEVSAQDFGSEPRNTGLSRHLAVSHSGSWVGSLFLYVPPKFGFSRSEQRLLSSALRGGTDEELSDELGISLAAVKKTWRMIYERVAACQPGLVPTNSQSEQWTQNRGKQKKPRLLAYLREHPEELRPVSRKLLQQEVAQGRPTQGTKSALDTSP
jgi:DNA-binding CsgD family transcriptional regulator